MPRGAGMSTTFHVPCDLEKDNAKRNEKKKKKRFSVLEGSDDDNFALWIYLAQIK